MATRVMEYGIHKLHGINQKQVLYMYVYIMYFIIRKTYLMFLTCIADKYPHTHVYTRRNS